MSYGSKSTFIKYTSLQFNTAYYTHKSIVILLYLQALQEFYNGTYLLFVSNDGVIDKPVDKGGDRLIFSSMISVRDSSIYFDYFEVYSTTGVMLQTNLKTKQSRLNQILLHQ